jgi:hypothetical protein
MGTLVEIKNKTTAVLRTRQGVRQEIDLKLYTLEPTQRVLQRFEEAAGGSPRRVWQQIQRQSFSLDEHGSRNKRVLLDRLDAIRRTLADDINASVMTLDTSTFSPTRIILRLEPTEVAPGGHVLA